MFYKSIVNAVAVAVAVMAVMFVGCGTDDDNNNGGGGGGGGGSAGTTLSVNNGQVYDVSMSDPRYVNWNDSKYFSNYTGSFTKTDYMTGVRVDLSNIFMTAPTVRVTNGKLTINLGTPSILVAVANLWSDFADITDITISNPEAKIFTLESTFYGDCDSYGYDCKAELWPYIVSSDMERDTWVQLVYADNPVVISGHINRNPFSLNLSKGWNVVGFIYLRGDFYSIKKMDVNLSGSGDLKWLLYPDDPDDPDIPIPPDTTQERCDGTPPQLGLVGPTTVTILANSEGQAELNRLMGQSNGWNSAVSWTGDVTIIESKLTIGGVIDVPYNPGDMPALGQYVIVYRATKDMCEGVVPEAVVQRGLIILEYTPIDERPPIVRLTGQNTVSIDIGNPYTDLGVAATDGDGVTTIQLDSIKVTSGTGGSVGISTIKAATTQASLSQLNDQLTAKNTAAGTYIVTYYVTSPTNGTSASVSRTVEFMVGSSVGLPVPVIVLNKYRHVIQSNTIEHVDTAFAIGGSYREIGVKEVYYMKDGVKTSIPVGNVALPTVQPSNNPAQRTATYSLPASAGTYQSAIATRYLYIWDSDCEDNFAPPTITWNDGGGDQLSLSLSSGGEWNYISSWRTTGNDEVSTFARKYLVDLDGLDRLETSGDGSYSNRAVLKTGTYTITYVGLGGCGGITVKMRTLTVTP